MDMFEKFTKPKWDTTLKKQVPVYAQCEKCEYHCTRCDEIAASPQKCTHIYGDSLCWCCANSVPGHGFGCAYSLHNEPVAGWEATERYVDGHISYRVRKCPGFIRG